MISLKKINIALALLAVIQFAFSACNFAQKSNIMITNGNVRLTLNKDLSSNIYAKDSSSNRWKLISTATSISKIQYLNSLNHYSFYLFNSSYSLDVEKTEYGVGNVYKVNAVSEDSLIEESFTFITPSKLKDVIICKSSLKNISNKNVSIRKIVSSEYQLNAKDFGADSSYKFWSFQGGSYPERYDWIFPITKNYSRDNYQGMNAPDYGGGIPVVDLWTKDQGLAFASIAVKPQLISLPVSVKKSGVLFSIKDSNDCVLKPKQVVSEIPYAIIAHHGDYFNALRKYSNLMKAEGFSFPKAPSDAYQPEWCAWGYERNFNKEQILKSLNEVKKLGFKWVTIDDGWQNADGDWEPTKEKFPGGEKDFIALIDSIHSYGLKVRLWWVPFAAQDSSYNAKHFPNRMNDYGMKTQSKIALEHPDWFILDKKGDRVQVSWWNSYLLCPALPQVRNYYKKFVKKVITKWGIDGFKIDGQNLNEVPPCYNSEHNHKSPIASSQGVPGFFKELYQTAEKLKPGFLIQACPCGTNFSIYNLPFVNQTVASDPLSAWQVRLKGKTFKAIYGNNEAYSGDHVELTNRTWDDKLQKFIPHGKEDFASTIAVGGVPASKFTVGGIVQADSSLILNKAKKEYYSRWLQIYNKEKMSEGTYLNLYDIAYDKPETHLIKKGNIYYYSFFSHKKFNGRVELRGLARGSYKVYNLYTNKFIKNISSTDPELKISFTNHLLIKVVKGNH